jgi:hypothetical protein
MKEPNTDAMDQHLRKFVATVLKLDESAVQSKIEAVALEGTQYMFHMHVMINGKEPSQHQAKAIMVAIKHYGFPGIRVTNFHVPAEA